jgi:pyruvate/2-oxoglutarate dehydrogenase complex dihydrolipoamide dehydrogenase (E3) component
MDSLPDSMIILGAGPIGIEMSQALGRLGTKVSVIDRENQILVKEDRDMADAVMERLESEGVTFLLNSTIHSVKNVSTHKEVVITNNQGKEFQLKADTILVATGRRANTQDLGIEQIGIEIERLGIKVDQRLRTSQKHIYAAGDVNGGYQFTHAAGYEGGIVVSNAIFRLPRKTNYTYLPWATYTDPELASIGMNESAAQQAGIESKVWIEEFKDNDRSLSEGNDIGRIKMVVDAKNKPIGVQIFGPRAGDLISEWVAILNGGVKLSTVAGAIHPYPTLGEINKRVVGSLFAPKIFSNKIQKGLKLFFNLKGRACNLDDLDMMSEDAKS